MAKKKKALDLQDRATLNDCFYKAVFDEICGGDEKKFIQWLAKFATDYQKDFMKEWTKTEPKNVKVEQKGVLRYIKVGMAKEPVPDDIPILTEGEGSNVEINSEIIN